MLPQPLRRVVQMFARLPGVGEKTAQRFALQLMNDGTLAAELSRELADLAKNVRPCERCGNIAEVGADERAVCDVCSDPRRDGRTLCVVARVQDLIAIERSSVMRGRYFVLGKLLSPLDGIGPEELPLKALDAMLRANGVEEIILATPPSVDGEATALLLVRELANRGLRVSRIASGVPHGGDLEFADQITLGRAIEGRRSIGDSE